MALYFACTLQLSEFLIQYFILSKWINKMNNCNWTKNQNEKEDKSSFVAWAIVTYNHKNNEPGEWKTKLHLGKSNPFAKLLINSTYMPNNNYYYLKS